MRATCKHVPFFSNISQHFTLIGPSTRNSNSDPVRVPTPRNAHRVPADDQFHAFFPLPHAPLSPLPLVDHFADEAAWLRRDLAFHRGNSALALLPSSATAPRQFKRIPGCGLRVEGQGSRVKGQGLRVTGYGLRIKSYGLRVTGYTGEGLRV